MKTVKQNFREVEGWQGTKPYAEFELEKQSKASTFGLRDTNRKILIKQNYGGKSLSLLLVVSDFFFMI